jgi:hypothetical protein
MPTVSIRPRKNSGPEKLPADIVVEVAKSVLQRSVFWKSCEWGDPKPFVKIGQVDSGPIRVAQ